MQTIPRHLTPAYRCSPRARSASSCRLRIANPALRAPGPIPPLLPLTTLLLVVSLAACGAGGSGDGTAAPATVAPVGTAPPANPATPPSSPSADNGPAGALDQLNAARAVARHCGTTRMPAVAPLRWNTALEQAAIGHSKWMQANDTFSHDGAGGSSVGTRATAAGYAWRSVGENIAAGQADVASVIATWLASPGHCANIMHADFVDVALALEPGTSSNTYRSWWTLDFGRPR